MNRAHGQIRRGQVIGTYGPGALIDLPNDSAIVGGLETWSTISADDEIVEPRLSMKLQTLTGVTAPRLYAPPPESTDPSQPTRGIGVWRFPEWFVVQERDSSEERERSRRLVHRKALYLSQAELDVGEPRAPDVLAGQGDHLRRHIYPYDMPAGPDEGRRRQAVQSRAASQVKDALPWLEPSHSYGVA